jgi:hypothetical protein
MGAFYQEGPNRERNRLTRVRRRRFARIAPMRAAVLGLAMSAVACASSNQQQGTFAIGAGETHFSATQETDVERLVTEPPVSGGPGPGVQFKPEVCEGIDLRPPTEYLGVDDLTAFLESRAIPFQVRKLRSNLSLVKIQAKNAKDLELRVATLDSPAGAASELHNALLEHGQGSWGLHRANLSVLGPIGSFEDVIGVTAGTGLACWGSLHIAGRDDTFAIGGGYIEF